MGKFKVIQIFNLITLAAVLLFNGLISTFAPNSVAEISDLYSNLFTPAAYTFSIWAAIYLLLIIFAIKQSRNLFNKHNPPNIVNQLGYWFIIVNLLNIAWLFAWTYSVLWLSLILIIGILISLLIIYSKVKNYKGWDYVSFQLPFSVYLGWISVATIANVVTLLVSLGFTGFTGFFGAQFFAILVLIVALGLGTWYVFKLKDYAYATVLVWSFIGIFVAQTQISTTVGLVAFAAALLQSGIIIFQAFLKK